MAQEQGSLFFYETTVMDGTPVFNLVRETLKLCRVTEVEGISTPPPILSFEELAKGKEYDSVIRRASAADLLKLIRLWISTAGMRRPKLLLCLTS